MWRRVTCYPVLILIALFLVPNDIGQSAAANAGASIKGVGGGWVGYPPGTPVKFAQFSFSAHSGPNGDFGQAQFTIDDPLFPLDVTVNVDCVNMFPFVGVHGAGWFSGRVTKVNDPTGTFAVFPDDAVYFSIYDGGEPVMGATDNFNPIYAFYVNNVSCKVLDVPFFDVPNVTQGNIVINPE